MDLEQDFERWQDYFLKGAYEDGEEESWTEEQTTNQGNVRNDVP